MEDYILKIENVSKEFPGVQALDNISMNIKKGSVHALVGENGAGKSTLMKILIGALKRNSGNIIFDNEEYHMRNMKDAENKGLSMIFQEFNLVPNMTVAENIFLGREPKTRAGIFINKNKMNSDAQKLIDTLKIENVKPNDMMYNLSIAKRQMVEICKALSYHAKLIIMDEPTSSLTDKECENLFNIIQGLKTEGVTFIFITHKLNEIFEVSDQITVMRDGRIIATDEASNFTRERLIKMMVGRGITQMFPKQEAQIGEVVLSVKSLTIKGLFNNISFDLKKGEILGLAGLIGAGRTEVMEAVFGYRKLDSGHVIINGKQVHHKAPRQAIYNKIAFITEDRKLTGLFPILGVADNMIMPSLRKFIKLLFINSKKVKEVCLEEKERFNIKITGLKQLMQNLSGGNQQKVLVSRWLITNAQIIIIDEPTRGIDVGSKAEIHKYLSNLAKEGKSILMISSELPEIIGMCDRVIVMHEGTVKGTLDRSELSQVKIMELATGGN